MSERTEELERTAAAERAALSETLDRVEERVEGLTEWREGVRRHPLPALGVAFGAGLLASGALSSVNRMRPVSRIGAGHRQDALARERGDNTTRMLVRALVSIASSKAVELLISRAFNRSGTRSGKRQTRR
jgi:hypothetical protein